MDYNEELQTDFDLTDPDDRRAYDIRYIKKLKSLSDPFESDVRDENISEMEKLDYTPSNRPETDAEINWLKCDIARKKKQYQFSKSEESFLQFQAQESGKSVAQVKREARKFLKGGK